MENKIKVSVILPIYNVEEYLVECIDSIVNQTLRDIEIICVNDGSKDSSLEILQRYESVDSRVTVLSQENLGVSTARNNGLKLAKGEFVCFVDPDDWVENVMLETMYERAKKYDADMVECDIIEHLENNDKTRLRKLKLKTSILNKIKIKNGCVYSWHDIKNHLFQTRAYSVNRLYKKSMLFNNDISYPNFGGEDFYFVLDSVLSASKIIYVNKPFYHYRKRKNSLSSGNPHIIKNDSEIKTTDVIEYVRNILKKHGVCKIFESELDNWIIQICFCFYMGNTIQARLRCQSFLSKKQQVKLEEKIQNNGNKFLECLFSVKSEILQGSFYKKVSLFGYRWYFKIK